MKKNYKSYKIYMIDNWEVTLVCFNDDTPVFNNDYTDINSSGIYFKGCLARDIALFFQDNLDMRKKFSRFYLASPESLAKTLQEILAKIESTPFCKCVGEGDLNGLVVHQDNMNSDGAAIFQKAINGIDRLENFTIEC